MDIRTVRPADRNQKRPEQCCEVQERIARAGLQYVSVFDIPAILPKHRKCRNPQEIRQINTARERKGWNADHYRQAVWPDGDILRGKEGSGRSAATAAHLVLEQKIRPVEGP